MLPGPRREDRAHPGSEGMSGMRWPGPSRSSPRRRMPSPPTSSGIRPTCDPREDHRRGGVGRHRRESRHLVAGIGTGGTITGVSKALKARKPGVQIVGVEPRTPRCSPRAPPVRNKIQGIGANFVPEVPRPGRATTRSSTSNSTTPSGGANWVPRRASSAVSRRAPSCPRGTELVKRPENAGKLIVAVVCDYGERYISTVLFDDIRDWSDDRWSVATRRSRMIRTSP